MGGKRKKFPGKYQNTRMDTHKTQKQLFSQLETSDWKNGGNFRFFQFFKSLVSSLVPKKCQRGPIWSPFYACLRSQAQKSFGLVRDWNPHTPAFQTTPTEQKSVLATAPSCSETNLNILTSRIV